MEAAQDLLNLDTNAEEYGNLVSPTHGGLNPGGGSEEVEPRSITPPTDQPLDGGAQNSGQTEPGNGEGSGTTNNLQGILHLLCSLGTMRQELEAPANLQPTTLELLEEDFKGVWYLSLEVLIRSCSQVQESGILNQGAPTRISKEMELDFQVVSPGNIRGT